MFQISKDCFQCTVVVSNQFAMFSIYFFCFQSYNIVFNLFWCFQSTLFSNAVQSVLPGGHIDVGDGCWRPNVLVTSHVTKIKRHQHHILAYTNVGDRCKFLGICLQILKQMYWIWHHVELHVANITFWHIMNHNLWCWWPIGMTSTRRKMSLTSKNGHHH